MTKLHWNLKGFFYAWGTEVYAPPRCTSHNHSIFSCHLGYYWLVVTMTNVPPSYDTPHHLETCPPPRNMSTPTTMTHWYFFSYLLFFCFTNDYIFMLDYKQKPWWGRGRGRWMASTTITTTHTQMQMRLRPGYVLFLFSFLLSLILS